MLTAILMTCASLLAVDGDTVKCDGVNLRDMGDGKPFVSGYDTPEIHHAKCDAERQLGYVAKARMEQLLATPGIQVLDSGERDTTQSRRPLVWVKLPDDRSVGSVLMAEGLAREWNRDYRADWC